MKKILIILTCFIAFGCQNQQSERDLSMGKYKSADETVAFDEEIEIDQREQKNQQHLWNIPWIKGVK